MITRENFKSVLKELGFEKTQDTNIYEKRFLQHDNYTLKVNFFGAGNFDYGKGEKSVTVYDKTTSNFSHDENFVVFECVCRLLEKGYRPEHLELEPRWSLGHGEKSGKADICIKNEDGSKYLCIIECKTAGAEYKAELSKMKENGGQLFSYWEQESATKWLVLYASDYDSVKECVTYSTKSVDCSDDSNKVDLAENGKGDTTIKLYKNSYNVEQKFQTWVETYEQKFSEDVLFGDETVAYKIGERPLRKKDLVDFKQDDKIVNTFEEILRHNNISDKENSFNRMVALFIAKLADEYSKQENDEVEFQYKKGSDTYESLQNRLQKLHKIGMQDFMGEEIFYVDDDYVKNTIMQYTGSQRYNLQKELEDTIKQLKYYTNNDFSFKDVHNRELFLQNGKILVEMVELFQDKRLIDSNDLQLLGDMFEQLLNHGFKQNEGQFFTPLPIVRFIWKSIPLHEHMVSDNGFIYPKIIDYACGAGHFLTAGFEEINKVFGKDKLKRDWERDSLFGIEKDYRLARVSKISLYMHGAGNGNIKFGDGLENYPSNFDKKTEIKNGKFDILVANPPYSVSAFKQHLKLHNNTLHIADFITNDGSEIETLFVERTAQLLKPNGIAAVILPSSILSNGGTSYVKAREIILDNFDIKSIVQLGSKTFGATGTNTVVMFMKKHDNRYPKSKMIDDSVNAIFSNNSYSENWGDEEIFNNYLAKIKVARQKYIDFIHKTKDYDEWKNDAYFNMYVAEVEQNVKFKKIVVRQKKTEADVLKEKNNFFYSYVTEIEKNKMHYFALSYNQRTLIVTAPSENSAQEKFLGYTWSNRKGDEGIKLKEREREFEKCGLLYNDADEQNSIASYVRDSIIGIYERPGNLDNYIVSHMLSDMLDFSRTTFDKAIKAAAGGGVTSYKVLGTSKFPLVKLGEVAEIVRGVTFDKNLQINENIGKVVLTADNISLDGHFNIEKEIFVSNEADFDEEKKLKKNDCFMCFSSGSRNHVGKVALIKNDTDYYAGGFMGILRAKEKIISHFLYEILNSNSIREVVKASAKGSNILNLSNSIGELKIPLPPLDVQKQIIAECEKIEADFENAQKQIEDAKQQIAEIMQTTDLSPLSVRLGDVCQIIKGVTFDKNLQINENVGKIVLTADNISLDGHFSIQKEIYISNDADFDENKKLKKDDCFICFSSGSRNHVGKVALISEDTNYYAGGFMGILRPTDRIIPHYLYNILNSPTMREKVKNSATGSNILNLSNAIKDLEIPVPPIAEQKKIVSQIEVLEKQIAASKNVLAACPDRKADVLRKWLEV